MSLHSVYGNVITYPHLLFVFCFLLAHGTNGAWKTYIPAGGRTWHFAHWTSEVQSCVILRLPMGERSRNLKLQATTVHKGEQHKHSQGAQGSILPDAAQVFRLLPIAEKFVVKPAVQWEFTWMSTIGKIWNSWTNITAYLSVIDCWLQLLLLTKWIIESCL